MLLSKSLSDKVLRRLNIERDKTYMSENVQHMQVKWLIFKGINTNLQFADLKCYYCKIIYKEIFIKAYICIMYVSKYTIGWTILKSYLKMLKTYLLIHIEHYTTNN